MSLLLILLLFLRVFNLNGEILTDANKQADAIRLHKDHSLVLVPVSRRHQRRSVDVDVDSEEDDKENDDSDQKKYRRLAHSVHIRSDIRLRYATTLITSEVFNPENRAREIFLTVILPDTAFISRFALEIGEQLFVAYVKEKEAAWREYQDAVSEGKTAGHVGISARHSNQFRVSVNTEKFSTVTFFLVYEELLRRKGGLYEHTINITPRQKLRDFSVQVSLTENKNLTHIEVPNLRRHEISVDNQSDKLDDVSIRRHSASRATVTYRPDVQKLQELLWSKYALQFSVIYDVERADKGGELEVRDGYFVHFVAPENLPPMSKHVVFVLDTSGSMQGKKLVQTQNAIKTILSEMRPDDHMTIITFADEIALWELSGSTVVDATPDNIIKASTYVDSLEAKGGTNINDALLSALEIIQTTETNIQQSMIFFLTDGHATFGEVDSQVIMQNVRKANSGDKAAAIFCLAFGRQADFELLKILAVQNFAFARKIYIAADASLQLEGFYKEVSSPILKDVQFVYANDDVERHTLTSTNFYTYYQGSEMVVAGHLNNHQTKSTVLDYEIIAAQALGNYRVDGVFNGSQVQHDQQGITETSLWEIAPKVRIQTRENILERLWAYLTIQDLLHRIARGELNSCEAKYRTGRSVPHLPKPEAHVGPKGSDDEDYYYDVDGSGAEQWDEVEEDTVPTKMDDVMEEIGDSDLVICDNLERALYLSLKYEFVTPMTSLVVVKPNSMEQGDLSNVDDQADPLHKITFRSIGIKLSCSEALIMIAAIFKVAVF